jgi:hypothetical protein
MTYHNIAIAAGVLLVAVVAIVLLALNPWSAAPPPARSSGDVDCSQQIDVSTPSVPSQGQRHPPFPTVSTGRRRRLRQAVINDTVSILCIIDPGRANLPAAAPSASLGSATPSHDERPQRRHSHRRCP